MVSVVQPVGHSLHWPVHTGNLVGWAQTGSGLSDESVLGLHTN